MADLFHSAKRRLSRAKSHVIRLGDETKKFLKTVTRTRVDELSDADSSMVLHKVRFGGTIPESCVDTAAEAIEGLRAVLDQTAFATAVAGGKPNAKSAYFPIANTADELENVIKGKCKDIPQDIVSLFRSFKPYKEGNTPIWVLNQLCNVSKHRILNPIAVHGGTKFSGSARSGSVGIATDITWNPDKKEVILLQSRVGSDFKISVDIFYTIAFQLVQNIPAPEVLETIAGEVERIVLATEAECRRIHLIN